MIIRLRYFFTFIFIFSFYNILANADIIQKIEINGNERISNETIILFSEISLDQKIEKQNLNNILKKLYQTNFFSNVSLSFNENTLFINVQENPIIENINYNGI